MTITFLHLRSWCIIILLPFFTAECFLLLTYSIYFSFHLICLIYCIELGSLKDIDNLLDHPSKTINSQRESDTSKSVLGRNDILKPRVDDHKQKLGRSSFFGSSSDKVWAWLHLIYGFPLYLVRLLWTFYMIYLLF